MNFRHVSIVLPYTMEGKVLLQDRRSISKVGELWGFFGGGIEEGETPEAAAVREMREELGWTLTDPSFLGTLHNAWPQLLVTLEMFCAPCPPLDALRLGEGDGMELVTLDDARAMLPEQNAAAIDALQAFFDVSKR